MIPTRDYNTIRSEYPIYFLRSWCLMARKGMERPLPKNIMKYTVSLYLNRKI